MEEIVDEPLTDEDLDLNESILDVQASVQETVPPIPLGPSVSSLRENMRRRREARERVSFFQVQSTIFTVHNNENNSKCVIGTIGNARTISWYGDSRN